MSEILYIEGKRVDLLPDTISRTLQINDIGDAKDRQTNFSNTTKLPLTPNNVNVFNFLGVHGNRSIFPYRKLKCDYILNGIQLIKNGYALVKGTNSHYEVVIYDGLVDLAERIKGKKVNELNFSDLNHYLSQDTYQNSLFNTEGFIYALGEFLPKSFFNVRIEHQAPSLFIKTIWEKIWNEAGLQYSGNFFTDNVDFQTEVITPEVGYPVENVELTSTPLGTAGTDIILRNSNSNDPLTRFDDQHKIFSGGFTGIVTNPDGSLVISESGQYNFTIDTTYNNFSSWVRFEIKVNGATLISIGLPEGGNFKQSVINATLNAEDVISFWVHGSYGVNNPEPEEELPGGGQTVEDYRIDYDTSSDIQITKLSGGQFIDFAVFTTDIDQLAFVTDILQRYALLLKPVRNSNVYEFIQFEQLLNDKINAEDWSDKLDQILGESYGINYAQNNIANYNYPEEIVEKLYDGVLVVDNENATPEKNLFSSPYEIATTRPRKFNGKSIYQVHIWEEKEEDGSLIIVPKETAVKIFRISRVQTTISTYFFNNSNSVNVSGEIPFLSLENMEMQYFLNNYYKAFQSLINRAKQVEASLLINEIDIYNLDFFRLKYLKQTGKYYYLNHIKHSTGKISRGEIIELNRFSENYPPTTLGVYIAGVGYENTRPITVQQITELSDPAYFDPEFDEPAAIMITGGFNFDILIKNGTQILTTQTEIPIEEWDLQIQDKGNTTAAHSAAFTYKIKDKGSGRYSEVEGTIQVNVNEYVNNPPVANAGEDSVKYIPFDGFYSTHPLDGSGSYDFTGSIVFYWTIVSKPINSSVTIINRNNATTALDIPNNQNSIGIYTLELIIYDEFGVSDADTVQIIIREEFDQTPST